MKIIVGDKAYLQKFVLAFMVHEFSALPACIMTEAFSSVCAITVNGQNDAVRFGYCFENPETVDFIRDCDWLLDFEEYCSKSIDELIALRNQTRRYLECSIEEFNSSSLSYRKEHYEQREELFDRENLKILSLDMLINCKNGRIAMPEVPDENTVLDSNGFVRFDEELYNAVKHSAEKTPDKKGFFRRFFKRGDN